LACTASSNSSQPSLTKSKSNDNDNCESLARSSVAIGGCTGTCSVVQGHVSQSQSQSSNNISSTPDSASSFIHEYESASASATATATATATKSVSAPSSTPSSAPSSAVINALEQRKLRAVQKRKQYSSTIIQSYYRSYASNNKLILTQKDKLHKRLNDLIALGNILTTQQQQQQQKQQQQQQQQPDKSNRDSHSPEFEYVPPPSLAIGMINQLLFITHTIPTFHNKSEADLNNNHSNNHNKNHHNNNQSNDQQREQRVYHSKIRNNLTPFDAKLICTLIKHVLLPGVLSSNVHMDPMLVWLESKEGIIKLKKLLRLCCFILVHKKHNPVVLAGAAVGAAAGAADGAGTGGSTSHSPFLITDETKDVPAIIHLLRRLLIRHHPDDTNTSTNPRDVPSHSDRSVTCSSALCTLARQRLISKCRSLLLSSNVHYRPSLLLGTRNDTDNNGTTNNINNTNNTNVSSGRKKLVGQMPLTTEPLDLINLLRSFLLCPSGRIVDNTILPTDADKLREKSVHPIDRKRGDTLFLFVLDVTVLDGDRRVATNKKDDTDIDDDDDGADRRRLNQIYRCRFYTEIITCPLLTWKIQPTTVRNFVTLPDLLDQDTGGSERQQQQQQQRQPSFLRCLSAFLRNFDREISQGLIGSPSVLSADDVPLTLCPAPAVLCLLANMVLFGRICPILNGSDTNNVDYHAGAMYFNTLAAIIDIVPLGSLSSRQSSVEWLSHGSHLRPIVLSNIIRDQCKLFLVDSFVRQLFNCAIDERTLDSDRVLRRKDRKDTAMENELWEAGSSSATALAAQEAMVDRSKKFWHSRWAKKLSKKMVSFVSLTFLQPSQSLFPLSSVLLPLPISYHVISSCRLGYFPGTIRITGLHRPLQEEGEIW